MNTAKENLEYVKGLSANGYELSRQLGELNVRTAETLFAKQMEAFSLWMDGSIKQVELVSSSRDYKTLWSEQTEAAKELGESLVAKGREAFEAAGDARDEYRTWYKDSVEKLSAKPAAAPKKAAAKTAKKS